MIKKQKGQTMVEWLLLMAMIFMTAYLMMIGPLSRFAEYLLTDLRGRIGNVVRNAESVSGGVMGPDSPRHPMSSNRFKPLH